MKKLAVIVAVIMIVSLLPLSALAADLTLAWADGCDDYYRTDSPVYLENGEAELAVPDVENTLPDSQVSYSWYWQSTDGSEWDENFSSESVITALRLGHYECTVSNGQDDLIYGIDVQAETNLRWADGDEEYIKFDDIKYIEDGPITLEAPEALNDCPGEYPVTYSWEWFNDEGEGETDIGNDPVLEVSNAGNYQCRIADGSGKDLYYAVNVRFASGLAWADGYEEITREETQYLGLLRKKLTVPEVINNDGTKFPVSYSWSWTSVDGSDSRYEISDEPTIKAGKTGYYECEITDGSGNCLVYFVKLFRNTDLRWADGFEERERDGGILYTENGPVKITVPETENDYSILFPIRYTWDYINDDGLYEEEIGSCSSLTAEKPGVYMCTIWDKSGNTLVYTIEVRYTLLEGLFSGEAHVQTFGDTPGTFDGTTFSLGTKGQSKRLESVTVGFQNTTGLEGGLEYRVHCQGYGWLDWTQSGQPAGTQGESKRLEAIEMKLYGEIARCYSIRYRVHVQGIGDQDWKYDGELAGTTGLSLRLENLEVQLVPKAVQPMGVEYRTHRQTYGWEQTCSKNGETAGTTGESKRLEGICINLTGNEYGGGIRYSTHVQTYGWQDWKEDGEMAGTQGESKRLEAIKIELTGDAEYYYDVYYRVHSQTYGWLGWVKNGDIAGTVGQSKRLEAIQIVLVEKGAELSPEVIANSVIIRS